MTKGHVLITGVTGFIGTAVARAFVDDGYSVRAVSRTRDKINSWGVFNAMYKDKVEWVLVEDFVLHGSFNLAMKNVDYVVHIASPVPEDLQKDLIEPAIKGTQNILQAAKSNPGVKHMVFLSSFAAVTDLTKYSQWDRTYSSKDWIDASHEEMTRSDNAMLVYSLSKALAERLILDDQDRKFSVTSICPPRVYGPHHAPLRSIDDINMSNSYLWDLISGKESDEIPTTDLPAVLDVRDLAAMHIRALENPSAKEKRYVPIAYHMLNRDVVGILRKSFAGDPTRIARIKSGAGDTHPWNNFKFDRQEAEALLGRPFISAEQCVVDTASRLWELEVQLKQGGV